MLFLVTLFLQREYDIEHMWGLLMQERHWDEATQHERDGLHAFASSYVHQSSTNN